MISNKIKDKIRIRFQASNLPEESYDSFLISSISEITRIQSAIEAVELAKEEADRICRETIRGLDRQLIEIYKSCNHSMSTRHPDPSGNNDVSYTCDVCHKEL